MTTVRCVLCFIVVDFCQNQVGALRSAVLPSQARHSHRQDTLIRGQFFAKASCQTALISPLLRDAAKEERFCAQLKRADRGVDFRMAQRTPLILVSGTQRVMENTGGEGRLKQDMWGAASDWAHLPVSRLLFLLSFNKIRVAVLY